MKINGKNTIQIYITLTSPIYESGIEITNLPGTTEPFVLHKYKEDLGKDYKRITLYLCPENGIFISTKTFFDSDNDSESEESVKKVENNDQFEPNFLMDQHLYDEAVLNEPSIFEPVLNDIVGSINYDNQEIVNNINAETNFLSKYRKDNSKLVSLYLEKLIYKQ